MVTNKTVMISMNAIQIMEDVIKSVLIMMVAIHVVVILDIISEVMD